MGVIRYKFDVLDALKAAGYNTVRIRKEHLLAEGTVQSLRDKKPVTFVNLAKLCGLLGCQPGDLLEYSEEEQKEGE